MKKATLRTIASALIVGSIITSCNTHDEKVEKAQKEVIEANKALIKAEEDSRADYQNYRKEIEDKTAINDQSIAELKASIKEQKRNTRADYEKKIAKLEQKNSDLKKKMDDFKMESKDKWEKFKAEFSHDMDELGKAFKDLTVNNVK